MLPSSKRLISCLVVLLYLGSLSGQTDPKVDSLITIVEQSTVDSVKMINLLGLVRLKLGRDPDQAASFAQQVISLGRDNGDHRRLCTAYSYLANIKYITSDIDSAYHFLDQAHAHGLLAKDSLRAFNCLQNKAVILHSNSQLDEALEICNSNFINFRSLGDSIQMANAILLTGSIYSDKGYTNLALEKFYQALKVYENQGHKYLMAEAYFQIGGLDLKKRDIHTSNDFLHKAIDLYEQTDKPHRKAQAIMALGLNSLSAEDYDLAKTEFEEAYEFSQDIGFKSLGEKVKISLAKVYAKQGQPDKAQKLAKESIAFYKEEEDHFNEIEARFALADILYEKQDFKRAAINYKTAIELSEEKSYPVFLERGYKRMSKIAEFSGSHHRALRYLTKYNAVKDSLSLINQNKQLEELHLIYKTEQNEANLKLKETEIKVLSQEVRNGNMKKLFYGVAFLLTLISLFFIQLWYRQKLSAKDKEQEQKTLIHLQEMKFKESELTNQALHLVKKNTLIEKLTERLQHMQNSDGDLRRESARLLSSLKLESELNRDWVRFQDYFLQVHNNFDTKLMQLNPKLNENDLRLAYLIKTKLNTQEIASSLHVLPESIRKSKYRLKKKLNIPKEQDLIEFIMQF